jgi:general secretion pathway protein G
MASRTGVGERRVRARGFTLIELLVVLAILALLTTVAAPRLMGSIAQSKETVLRENLHIVRSVIERFYRDRRRYPASLAELVEQRYLRALPVDPVTGSAATWVPIAADNGAGVADVRSAAPGASRAGIPYSAY